MVRLAGTHREQHGEIRPIRVAIPLRTVRAARMVHVLPEPNSACLTGSFSQSASSSPSTTSSRCPERSRLMTSEPGMSGCLSARCITASRTSPSSPESPAQASGRGRGQQTVHVVHVILGELDDPDSTSRQLARPMETTSPCPLVEGWHASSVREGSAILLPVRGVSLGPLPIAEIPTGLAE